MCSDSVTPLDTAPSLLWLKCYLFIILCLLRSTNIFKVDQSVWKDREAIKLVDTSEEDNFLLVKHISCWFVASKFSF
jgi:hypothetical protein